MQLSQTQHYVIPECFQQTAFAESMTAHSLYGAPHGKKAYGAGLAWRQFIYKHKIMATNSRFIFLHHRFSKTQCGNRKWKCLSAMRLFKFKRLGYLGFNSGIGFLCSSCQSLRSDNHELYACVTYYRIFLFYNSTNSSEISPPCVIFLVSRNAR